MRILLLLSALALPPRDAAPPRPVAERIARISVRADTDSVVAVGILSDLADALDEVARKHGYDPQASLDGWLEPHYLAFASKRPDVPAYFASRAAYAADLSTHMDSIAMRIVERRLTAAGYPVMEQDQMREAFLRGYRKNSGKQRAALELIGRQARLALRMHEFLLQVESRVALDPKTQALIFERPLEHRRYRELAVAIDAANDEIAQLAGQPRTAQRGQR